MCIQAYGAMSGPRRRVLHRRGSGTPVPHFRTAVLCRSPDIPSQRSLHTLGPLCRSAVGAGPWCRFFPVCLHRAYRAFQFAPYNELAYPAKAGSLEGRRGNRRRARLGAEITARRNSTAVGAGADGLQNPRVAGVPFLISLRRGLKSDRTEGRKYCVRPSRHTGTCSRLGAQPEEPL